MLVNPGSAGTLSVNGQLTSQAPGMGYNPVGYMPYSAMGGNFPPSIPPSVGGTPALGSSGYGMPSTYASADDNNALIAAAQQNPWSAKSSPVIPAIIALAISLFLLHNVHFRRIGD